MRSESVGRLSSRAFDLLAGNSGIEKVWISRTANSLRILAYHGVDDTKQFDAQMAHLRSRYNPVSVDQVLASLDGTSLPSRSVWVTFDDGHPSVVENGLTVLEKWGIPATMFVCPAVVNSVIPLWWQAIENALASGGEVAWNGRKFKGAAGAALLVKQLKTVPDVERRRVVDATMADARLENLSQSQLSRSQIERITDAGSTLGNHTWDHPCLNQCEPGEQRRQIRLAHSSLTSTEPLARPVFAYPNGNWTSVAEDAARELGYRIGLLFDHRLTDRGASPLSWSRLRVNASTDLPRFRSILSGIHPVLTSLRDRWKLGRTASRNTP